MKPANAMRRARQPGVGAHTRVLTCVALAALTFLGTGAEASNKTSTAALLKTTPLPTYVAGKGAARFNWLAPERAGADKTTRTARRQPVANGSYVCSPAGFGRNSRCYAR